MTIDKKILDEAEPIIDKLAKSRSSNGAFAYYETNDVYQEIWYMCLDALGRYNPEIGPIEHYLVRHVTNRLKNLKRDKYFRPGSDVSTSGLARTRMNLVNALPLSICDATEQGALLCASRISIDPLDHMLCEETLDYIFDKLPEHLVEPLEELIGHNRIRNPLMEEIRQKIAEILTEREKDVRS